MPSCRSAFARVLLCVGCVCGCATSTSGIAPESTPRTSRPDDAAVPAWRRYEITVSVRESELRGEAWVETDATRLNRGALVRGESSIGFTESEWTCRVSYRYEGAFDACGQGELPPNGLSVTVRCDAAGGRMIQEPVTCVTPREVREDMGPACDGPMYFEEEALEALPYERGVSLTLTSDSTEPPHRSSVRIACGVVRGRDPEHEFDAPRAKPGR